MGGVSRNTASRYVSRFDQAVIEYTIRHNLLNKQIGGKGIKVLIDEAKLGKRKYTRGHRVIKRGMPPGMGIWGGRITAGLR